MAIDPLNPAPRLQPVMNQDGSLNYDWDRFFQNTYSTVNTIADATTVDNLMVNGNFHFNDGVSSTVTHLDGDGEYFSERWQVSGASNADYTINHTEYGLHDIAKANSSSYKQLDVSNHNGQELYIYQQFNGLHLIRELNGNSISFSCLCSNNTSNPVALQFAIYNHFDPDNSLILGRAVNLNSGLNVLRSSLSFSRENIPSSIVPGLNPYMQFRAYVTDFIDNCSIKLHYVKAEIGNQITPFRIDNAIERLRINHM